MPSDSHDQNLRSAFDGQAAKFEKAPVQTDPLALARLIAFANFPAGSEILDVGCGPGLISVELLRAGCDVVGVDLSPEMIDRAGRRCSEAPGRAQFLVGSIYDAPIAQAGPFDGAISRYVLHHVKDPSQFVARQVELIRPGGVLVLCDHTTDPDTLARAWHQEIEVDRDSSHTENLTPGQIVDLFAAAGLEQIRHVEEAFDLDFDEWFDRGTPRESKAAVRAKMLLGEPARGFTTDGSADGPIAIHCWRSIVRGVKSGG